MAVAELHGCTYFLTHTHAYTYAYANLINFYNY